MSKTVLEVVQAAALEMGLAAPNSAVSNSGDLTAKQLLALYNATGEMLIRRRVWRDLFTEKAFSTIVGTVEYALPADFNRPVSQTEWDRLTKYLMRGPATEQQWQWLKSAGVTTPAAYLPAFKLIGENLVLSVAPTDIRTLSYWYVSKYWVRDNGNQIKAAVTLDTDHAVFDDRLMTAGVKLRFYQAKGFDTTSYAADFQVALDDAMAQDGGAQVLTLSRRVTFPYVSVNNFPEGSWTP